MAKKVKPKAGAKKQLEKPLVKVPVEYAFWCHDGNIFADLEELAKGLAAMSDETFAYHCNLEKQDFSRWVRDVIEDEWLAAELARATDRLQAAECVATRMTLLTSN